MFQQQHIDAGEVKLGNKAVIKFPYQDDVSYINSIEGCGCSSVSLNTTEHCVQMEYLPESIPHHLAHQGYYTPTKAYKVGLVLPDGTITKYNLSFTIKVLR